MSIRASVFSAAVLACVMSLSSSSANAQANPCDSQSQRITCAQQCCGGRSCTPSCEAECVRACIVACKDPSKMSSYTTQMGAYQKRCGNRSVR
jgi:hypothetical protein